MQPIISSIHKSLCSDGAMFNSGFFLGFIQTVKFNKTTLDNPLSTIWDASLNGMFTGLGGLLASTFIPRPLKCIIPMSVLVCCIYYKYKDLKKID